MAWTAPRTWVAAETVTASLMNTHIRDNELALLGGLVGTGFTELDLLGTASAPAVAAASHATLYYDTAVGAIMASLNAGAYGPIGTPIFQNPLVISRWREIVRN